MSPNAWLLWRPPTSPLCFSGHQHVPKRPACAGARTGSGFACAPAAARSLVGGNSRRCCAIKTTDVQAGGQGLLIPCSLPKQTAQVGQGSPAMRGKVAVLRVNEMFAPCRHALLLFVSHWGLAPALLLFMLQLGVARRCRPCVAVSGVGIQCCRTRV